MVGFFGWLVDWVRYLLNYLVTWLVTYNVCRLVNCLDGWLVSREAALFFS